MQIDAAQAWNLYLEIEGVVKKSEFPREIDYALQRLCQAVLIQFKLKKEGYPKIVYYNRSLDVRAIKQLNLSTEQAMVNARVVEWEEAREVSSYVGIDDDSLDDNGYTTRLIPAAFKPQRSIQDCLSKGYFEVKAQMKAITEKV